MAKITQLKRGSENVYPLVHMDGVVDDSGNSISTMWNTKQEKLVSGSNLKTVNGTSLLGSGDLAVVSVDAGNINVLQSTGSSQVDVMSQKAVTDEIDDLYLHTERLTSDDLSSIENMTFGLPEGYTMLDYIDSGTAGSGAIIDTGLIPSDANWRFVGSWNAKGFTSAYNSIISSYSAETENCYRIIRNNQRNDSVYVGAYQRANACSVIYGTSLNTWYGFDLQKGKIIWTNTGTVSSLGTTTGTVSSATMILGSVYTGVMLGEFRAYHNGELVSRMIPCKTSNAVGMYDIIRETFYTSTNGNDFIAGNEITQPSDKLLNGNGLANLIVQETGDYANKVMSQKAITDAINYNINIERGTSVQMNGTLYTKITQEQVAMLNSSDVMSIRFMIYGSDCDNGGQDWRYTAFGSTGTASDVFVIRMHFSGKIIVGAGSTSQTTDLVAGQPNYAIHPIIATVVLDRVRGIVRYYKNTTLITEEIAEKYKREKFINPDGIIYFNGGDQNTRFYGVQFYDCDLQKCWRTNPVLDNEYNATLSEVTPKLKYIDPSLHSFAEQLPTAWYQNGSYTKTYNSDDDSYTMTMKDGTAGNFWFTNYGPSYGRMYEIIFTSDKQFHLIANYSVSSILYDMSGNIVTTCTSTSYESIPAGKYRLEIYWLTAASGIYVEEANATITLHSYRRRFIGCVAHFDFTTLYSGKLYDDISKQFYTLYSNSSCTTVSTQHTLSQLPIRGTYIMGNLSAPHYVGEIKVTGGKAYIADNTWTWKQINNS